MVVLCALTSACGFQAALPADAEVVTDTSRAADGAVADDAPEGIDAAPMHDAAIDAAPLPPVSVTLPVTADTYVDSINPSTVFGTTISLVVDGGTQPATMLLRADLSSIPATAHVTSAELHVWTSTDEGSTVGVYKVTEAWTEAAATYRDRMTGTPWTAQGAGPGSRDTTLLGSITPDAMIAERVVPNLGPLVQGWVTASATNFGVAVASNQSDGSTYRSREDTTTTHRPYFAITYQP